MGMISMRVIVIAVVLIVLVCWIVRSGIMRNVGEQAAVLYMVTVDASLNVFSAQNSSPQTTELFAKDRKATLMKYVWIGDATTLALGVFATIIASSLWPLAGAVTVVVAMHSLYVHAARKGSEKGKGTGGEWEQAGEGLRLVPQVG